MRWVEPTEEEQASYRAWVETRPAHIKAVAERFEPWNLYRLKTNKQRVYVLSFSDQADGTVTMTVAVTGQFNLLAFDRRVFGIKPEDLEPCDLPDPSEELGTVFTCEEIEASLPSIRAWIARLRPQ